MTQIFYLNSDMFRLIKMALGTVGGKYKKFDELKIYENDSLYEILTINKSEKFITKTIICKTLWRVKESICNQNGEEIKFK